MGAILQKITWVLKTYPVNTNFFQIKFKLFVSVKLFDL
jgi:hypothetical protein